LGDVRVREHRLLDLGRGDVVARGDDHVVAARLVPEVALVVCAERVAGDVPAVLHVVRLPRIVQVAAPGRTLDRRPAARSGRDRLGAVVHVGRHTAGDGEPGRARPDVVAGGGDEDVQHLRRPDAVDDADPGLVLELLPGAGRQVLAGRDRVLHRA